MKAELFHLRTVSWRLVAHQVERVGLAGEPAVAGEEAGERETLGLGEGLVGDDDGGDR
jgi:hypothetical protein